MPDPVDVLLELVRTDPARVALLTDFDGTLSAIVDDPAAAVPLPGALEAVDRLAAHLGLVSVVTGRPASFVADVLGPLVERVGISGLYGLESVPPGPGPAAERYTLAEEVLPWVEVVREVSAAAAAGLPQGVLIEPKGLSVTFHFRTAPELAATVEAFASEVAGTTGLLAVPGRAHVELRPPVGLDKGTAVRSLVAAHPGVDAVVFCGDDTGDLPAFAALAEMRAGGRTTLRVVAASVEADPRLEEAADLRVEGPSAVVAWLSALADLAELGGRADR